MKSQTVCCCGAKTLALTTGWLNTVLHGILSAIGIVIIPILAYTTEGQADALPFVFVGLATIAFFLIVPMIMGIVLIFGVKKRKAYVLMFWLIVNLFFAACRDVLLLLEIFRVYPSGHIYVVFIFVMIVVILELFCMWVVHVHRQEILVQNVSQMDPERDKCELNLNRL